MQKRRSPLSHALIMLILLLPSIAFGNKQKLFMLGENYHLADLQKITNLKSTDVRDRNKVINNLTRSRLLVEINTAEAANRFKLILADGIEDLQNHTFPYLLIVNMGNELGYALFTLDPIAAGQNIVETTDASLSVAQNLPTESELSEYNLYNTEVAMSNSEVMSDDANEISHLTSAREIAPLDEQIGTAFGNEYPWQERYNLFGIAGNAIPSEQYTQTYRTVIIVNEHGETIGTLTNQSDEALINHLYSRNYAQGDDTIFDNSDNSAFLINREEFFDAINQPTRQIRVLGRYVENQEITMEDFKES